MEPAFTDPTSLRRAFDAAQLYYVQDRTMEAIAAEFGTSRSTVSRLLKVAREMGIVTFQLSDPADDAETLAHAFADRFAVRARIVGSPTGGDRLEHIRRVAVTAAHDLRRFVESGSVIGVAWGSTIAEVSRHLVPKAVHDVTIVQLNGSGNNHTTGLAYASEILDRFSAAHRARVEQFPVPAFFDDPATREAMWRESSTRRILDLQSRMDTVIFSVGALESEVPGHVYSSGYLSIDDVRALEDAGAVGDVATVFYREDGSTDALPLNARGSGPDFATLRRAANRVCIVADTGKARSLRGALSAGLVTDLYVDEETARATLAH